MLLGGGGILAFGLYHVHSFSGVTEGGVLGATLLLEKWFSLSPALTSLFLNLVCYVYAFGILGKGFIVRSTICSLAFAAVYGLCELFPPLFSGLEQMPLVAAVLGAVFVGVGVGICVRAGGAPGGDDALAMALSRRWKLEIRWVYLISDLLILSLSLTYIPPGRMIYSLFSVLLSGQIIGGIEKAGRRKK